MTRLRQCWPKRLLHQLSLLLCLALVASHLIGIMLLRPRGLWPSREHGKAAPVALPDWARRALLNRLWPERQPRTLAELARELDAALRMPGSQMAIAPNTARKIASRIVGSGKPARVSIGKPSVMG